MHPSTTDYPAFVPAEGDRRGTARLLVQTAKENGLDPHSVLSVNGGFKITEELADLLGGVDDEDVDEEGADGDETSKSVPATQTDPQTRKGKGDSKADKKASTTTK